MTVGGLELNALVFEFDLHNIHILHVFSTKQHVQIYGDEATENGRKRETATHSNNSTSPRNRLVVMQSLAISGRRDVLGRTKTADRKSVV